MDRRERLDDSDLSEAMRAVLIGHQATVWTALPGIIRKVDLAKHTVEVEPAVQAKVSAPDGTTSWISIPMLVDVPILWPSGGGYTLTFPVLPGDEALVIFASRCIDSWWQLGGVQVQAELRLHDLSDGFALIGPRSQPRVLDPAAIPEGVELRNDARTAYIRISDESNITIQTSANVQVESSGDIYVIAGAGLFSSATDEISHTAPTIRFQGNVQITGNLAVSGTVTNDGVSIGKTHKHSGVSTGAGQTGNPV